MLLHLHVNRRLGNKFGNLTRDSPSTPTRPSKLDLGSRCVYAVLSLKLELDHWSRGLSYRSTKTKSLLTKTSSDRLIGCTICRAPQLQEMWNDGLIRPEVGHLNSLELKSISVMFVFPEAKCEAWLLFISRAKRHGARDLGPSPYALDSWQATSSSLKQSRKRKEDESRECKTSTKRSFSARALTASK